MTGSTKTRTFEFTLYLAGISEATLEIDEKLVAAGCDDGTFGSSNNEAFVSFDRESESLQSAITSAVQEVRNAGFEVARITSQEFETIENLNRELSHS